MLMQLRNPSKLMSHLGTRGGIIFVTWAYSSLIRWLPLRYSRRLRMQIIWKKLYHPQIKKYAFIVFIPQMFLGYHNHYAQMKNSTFNVHLDETEDENEQFFKIKGTKLVTHRHYHILGDIIAHIENFDRLTYLILEEDEDNAKPLSSKLSNEASNALTCTVVKWLCQMHILSMNYKKSETQKKLCAKKQSAQALNPI